MSDSEALNPKKAKKEDKNFQKPFNETGQSLINALVLKAKQGDEKHFGKLYELYFDKIYRFIYFRVNHKETAEDLAEEVFVKAWSKIKHVKAESFGGWLYQIAKNQIIDHYRKSKTTVDISEVENILESDENVVESTNLIMEQITFLELLKQLTPEQQIIIKLKFIEDLDNAEIAELISKSEGSIRVVQHRAIQKLQQLLDKQIEGNKLNHLTKNINNNINAEDRTNS
jgi:RNA polymerase sigma-70 factor (ECF subfamily)